MDEHRLEQLKALSKSAIGHAELVELARVHSPSQVGKLARSAGWGSRQIKSAQALARIRRDYTLEVFETFLVTMERARASNGVTEQAQDNRRTEMTQRTVKNLDRIKDPVVRLRLAVKRNLSEQAAATVTSLFSDWKVLFWTGYEEGEILFDTLEGVSKPGLVSSDDKDAVERHYQHRRRPLLGFFRSDDEPASLVADLKGMISFFGWTDDEVVALLSPVFQKITSEEPRRQNWRMCSATIDVCRAYLEAGGPVAKAVELWVLQSRLRGGRLFELRAVALPTKMENAEREQDELDPIVDRFVELGWTMDQVRSEFMHAIEMVVDNCRPDFMLALAGAKCFKYDDYRSGELGQFLRERYRPYVWDCLVSSFGGHFWPKMYHELLLCGLRGELRDEEEHFYRSGFIRLLAEGNFHSAWQLILALGPRALFYAEMASSLQQKAREYLTDLLPEAFAMAYEAGRFGIAAAFVQQFGVDALLTVDAERLCESFDDKRSKVDSDYSEAVDKWEVGDLPDDDPNIVRYHEALAAVETECAAALEKLKADRAEQVAGVTELAIDLEQPICFEDNMVYYVVPNWPRH